MDAHFDEPSAFRRSDGLSPRTVWPHGCHCFDIYPGRTREQIIVDLLAVALQYLEETMPCVPGERIIARDEFGDPVYEDVGFTPRFQAGAQTHLHQFKTELSGADCD